jgi:hypothetical protein
MLFKVFTTVSRLDIEHSASTAESNDTLKSMIT